VRYSNGRVSKKLFSLPIETCSDIHGKRCSTPSYTGVTQGKGARAAADWGVKGRPTSFVVDPEGRVILRAVGGTGLDDPAAIEQFLSYLPTP
jgi:hypothetical protein